MSDTDVPVYPSELMRFLKIEDGGTIRRQMKAGRLPPFDKVLSQKTRYWHRRTLVQAGILPPDQESANQPSPATSGAVPA